MSKRHPINKFAMEIEDANEIGNDLHVDLHYPDYDRDKAKKLIIGLCSVRSADEIRVSYDFDRNGWVIEQATIFEWDWKTETVFDRGWKEVAFAPAWQFDTREEKDD